LETPETLDRFFVSMSAAEQDSTYATTVEEQFLPLDQGEVYEVTLNGPATLPILIGAVLVAAAVTTQSFRSK